MINERVKAQIEELRVKKNRLEQQLMEPMAEMVEYDEALAKLIPKESRLRQKTTIRGGVRQVPARIREQFAKIGATIMRHEKAKKAIEKEHVKSFRAYRKTMKEWLRLQHKTEVYQLDVELDQIMTYYRASLAHLCAYFIKHYLGGQPIALATLFHRMNQLPATVEVTRHERRVTLTANEQDEPMMKMLRKAVEQMNAQRIRGHGDRVYRFVMT